MVPSSSTIVRVDFAVFVSPEYYEAETKVRLMHVRTERQGVSTCILRTHACTQGPSTSCTLQVFAIYCTASSTSQAPSPDPVVPRAPCPMSIPVSPQHFLDTALPISSVMLVHNGMNHALQRLKALAPRTHIVSLAPHVAAAAVSTLKLDVEWAMATLPFQPKVRTYYHC